MKRAPRILSPTTRMLVGHVLPRIDQRLAASTRPFDRSDLLRPHTRSRLWGWTHYGIFLPDLPDPYRYLNTMTLIGATGATCFDNDPAAAADARDTTTVLSTTAAGDTHHYAAYDVADCVFVDDGSRLRWGSELTIDVALPRVTVDAAYPAFRTHLELDVSDTASWFVRMPAYDHVSLLASYRGTLTDATGTHEIAGLGTFEYARCVTPQVLTRHVLPEALKVPVDFFTYQILDLDDRTQLLLTEVHAAGAVACRLAHLRTTDGDAEVFTDVTCDVLEHGDDVTDPAGRTMRVPSRLQWVVRHEGAELIRLAGDVDGPWRFGHGRGYVNTYRYSGEWRGRPISGTGYLEWVDCEVRRAAG